MEIKEQDNIPYSEKRIGNETQFAVDLRRDIIDLIVLMETYLNHAPRCERYCLCARIRDVGVQLGERMAEIRIAPSKSKEGYIKKLCYDVEKYRALVEVFRDAYYYTRFTKKKRAGIYSSPFSLYFNHNQNITRTQLQIMIEYIYLVCVIFNTCCGD